MELLKDKKVLIALGLLVLGGGFLYLRSKKAKENLFKNSTTSNNTGGNSTATNETGEVDKNLKSYTWSYNSGDTNSIACSQGAGQSLYSKNDTMVAGDTVYTDSKGLSVFNGKNAYWKKYTGIVNQTMQINDKGVVGNVSNC
jgi:hypothetical protein